MKHTLFVDVYQRSDFITRRSHTGIIIKVNISPNIWYSNSQKTSKVSNFGSKFISFKLVI